MYNPDGWEPHVLNRIYRSIDEYHQRTNYQNPYRFIDVGGFVGRYAYLIGSRLNTMVRSYEPLPNLYLIIKKKTNRMQNVQVFNYALGDVEEIRTIYSYKFSPNLPDSMSSGNTFNKTFGDSYKPGQTAKQEYQIQIHRLENVYPGAISGMKIDTEGWEVQVLDGAASLIDKYRPDLFLEYHGNKRDIANWLTVHHYTNLEWLDETDQFSYGLHGHMVAWARA
jgi:FkbM family methyltransferase